MPRVVDQLAELTCQRDRDVMDVSMVMALSELVNFHSAAIHRCVGDAGDERWLTRARLKRGDIVASSDPLWLEPELLPLVEDFPHRLDCLESQAVLQMQEQVDGRRMWHTLFPLLAARSMPGVLEIVSVDRLAPASRRMVAGMLRVFHNFQGLLEDSERDTLTGLFNRKTFDESFLKVVGEERGARGTVAGSDDGGDGEARHPPERTRCFLGVIDIDHFKQVNDRHGHLIGDEVLLLLSRLMRGSFRFYDQLYRFGGEEFVVLMRCASAADASQVLERLRYNTEQQPFPQVGHITVSVGFTEVQPGELPAEAFGRADRAVYYAKHHGRNQVRSYAQLVAAGELKVEEHEDASAVELF